MEDNRKGEKKNRLKGKGWKIKRMPQMKRKVNALKENTWRTKKRKRKKGDEKQGGRGLHDRKMTDKNKSVNMLQ